MTEEDTRSEHPSNKDEVECGWCGKTFETGDEMSAYEKEGIHRAKEHIKSDESIEQPDETHDRNLIDEYRENNRRKTSGQGGKA
jgi:hypothetical protein